jgi:glycosyltransferase involved in cell wall biosynthesis
VSLAPDVLLVGPWPPPRGGVSVHLAGLAEQLESDGLTVGVLNHFSSTEEPRVIAGLSRNPIRYLTEIRRLSPAVLHYHHSRFSTLLATAAARRSSPGTWIVSFHSHRVERHLRSRVPFVRLLTRWAIGRFDEVVAVSQAIGRSITAETDRPVIVSPAYLPPSSVAGSEVPASASRVLIAAASKVAPSSRRDTYRLDLVTDVFIALAPHHPDLRLELFLAREPVGRRARAYLDGLRSRLERAHLPGRVSIHVGASLADAFHPRSVYLRPTRTDGDAVSIREALDRGVPVIASDVVSRPAGVQTLPGDDEEAWTRACGHLLREPWTAARAARHPPAEALFGIYRRLLAARPGPTEPLPPVSNLG